MINTLTLNPAVDKILYVEEFKRNITTRIKEVKDTIGGKAAYLAVFGISLAAGILMAIEDRVIDTAENFDTY